MSHDPPEAFPVLDGDATLGDLQSPPAREVFRTARLDLIGRGDGLGYHVDDVSSCGTCPFSLVEWGEDGRHLEVDCGHGAVALAGRARRVTATVRAPSALDESPAVPPPAWCPLRAGPTLVRLVLD